MQYLFKGSSYQFRGPVLLQKNGNDNYNDKITWWTCNQINLLCSCYTSFCNYTIHSIQLQMCYISYKKIQMEYNIHYISGYLSDKMKHVREQISTVDISLWCVETAYYHFFRLWSVKCIMVYHGLLTCWAWRQTFLWWYH